MLGHHAGLRDSGSARSMSDIWLNHQIFYCFSVWTTKSPSRFIYSFIFLLPCWGSNPEPHACWVHALYLIINSHLFPFFLNKITALNYLSSLFVACSLEKAWRSRWRKRELAIGHGVSEQGPPLSLASLPVSRSLLTAAFPLPWFLKHIRTGDAQPLPFHWRGESVPAVWKSGSQWKEQSKKAWFLTFIMGGIRHGQEKEQHNKLRQTITSSNNHQYL